MINNKSLSLPVLILTVSILLPIGATAENSSKAKEKTESVIKKMGVVIQIRGFILQIAKESDGSLRGKMPYIQNNLFPIINKDPERVDLFVRQTPELAKQIHGYILKYLAKDDHNGKRWAEGARMLEANLEVHRLLQKGLEAYNASRHHDALQFWEKALGLSENNSDRQTIISILENLSSLYTKVGQHDKALSYSKKSYSLKQDLEREKDEKEMARLRKERIKLLNEEELTIVGNYKELLQNYEQALSIDRKSGNREWEADDLTEIGVLFRKLGRHEKALSSFQQALTVYQEIGNRKEQASNLIHIGMVLRYLGQSSDALSFYKEALALNREIENRKGESDALNKMGLIYSELREHDKAIAHFEKALSIDRSIGNRIGQASDLINLALGYRNLNQNMKSLQFMEQAVPLQKKISIYSGGPPFLTT